MESILIFLEDDVKLIQYCNQKRLSLPSSPTQSNFRVYASLIVKSFDGNFHLIEGTNTEQAYIGGAICAERSAIAKLRYLDHPEIIKVAVVTDSTTPVTPGPLCREYLNSVATPTTPVIMSNSSGTDLVVSTVGEQYPFPYLYRFQVRNELLLFAQSFSGTVKSPRTIPSLDPRAVLAYERACEVNSLDSLDVLHPIRFSSAVVFEDGSVEQGWQMKGLEYGCTLDAVSMLLAPMEKRLRALCQPCHIPSSPSTDIEEPPSPTLPSPQPVRALFLVMVDQFGVCHAPFAQARSLLAEHEHGDVQILVHNGEGEPVLVPASALLPAPSGTTLLTHSDFCS